MQNTTATERERFRAGLIALARNIGIDGIREAQATLTPVYHHIWHNESHPERKRLGVIQARRSTESYTKQAAENAVRAAQDRLDAALGEIDDVEIAAARAGLLAAQAALDARSGERKRLDDLFMAAKLRAKRESEDLCPPFAASLLAKATADQEAAVKRLTEIIGTDEVRDLLRTLTRTANIADCCDENGHGFTMRVRSFLDSGNPSRIH